jgi:cation diffusion facilitator CzcD-associated flavoprotein CzcO
MTPEHFDVLIIGAGLSGIGAGCHLQMECPGRRYVILEGRAASGGTWDLFRYPGIRSDSDMYTLGYGFRPWGEAKAIADGPSILNYIRETAADYGVDKKIRYRHMVKSASWSSDTATWTVTAERAPDGETVSFTCGFLFGCSGYYAYEAGYMPDFAGIERFGGQIIHPQHWPETLDTAGKRIVVIGSGATAVTLVPALAETAAQVTMLQRSPSYVVSVPAEDALANRLRRHLPAKLAYSLVRWRNVLWQQFFFNLARRKPERTRKQLIGLVQAQLGPDYDVATHFTPRYNPWVQRLCLVPDADLFRALRSGRAEVVTDHIEHFTETGLRLRSGRDLPADIIVTATGLKMQLLGGIDLSVDGERVNLGRAMSYKGMMYSDVPNLATSFGYTNASWTLKADLTCHYVCRLLNHMQARGYDECRPLRDAATPEAPFLDFTSGYVQRALDQLPRQGSKSPWKVHQNYARDLLALRLGKLDDGVMRFSRKPDAAPQRAEARIAEAASV